MSLCRHIWLKGVNKDSDNASTWFKLPLVYIVYLHNMEQLTLHKGLEVYLNFLDDEMWAVTCLDSLALCLLT
jgi:hypothetical protein